MRMKVSGLSPSVLTKVFMARAKNVTGVCFREYLWRGKSEFCTFIHVLYPVRNA